MIKQISVKAVDRPYVVYKANYLYPGWTEGGYEGTR